LVVVSILANQLWLGQVLFATVGTAWVAAVLLLNTWFIRTPTRPAELADASASRSNRPERSSRAA